MEPTTVITREEDLHTYFDAGSRARENWGVGVEYERFGVFRDSGRPLPYSGPVSVEAVLRELVEHRGWTPLEEDGHLIEVSRRGTRLTLEPGGQVELSGGVHGGIAAVRAELAEFLQDLEALPSSSRIAWLGVGLHPLAGLNDLPWIPKKRYAIMREYLPRRGRRAHIMMKQTASVQINLDFSNEADAVDKMRTAMGLTPLVTALFANSPLLEGRLNGMMSYRGWAWRDTDPDRCGLLPFFFKDGFGFRDYLDYALDVPMFFFVQDGEWRPAGGMTFRKFIRKGADKRPATIADFELHLSTLFPEVRLKHYIEMRGADASDPASSLALATLWKGILYDGASRREAWELVRDMPFRRREKLLDEICRKGPAARITPGGARYSGAPKAGVQVIEVLSDLIRLARQGLNNQGVPEEGGLLDRLDRLIAEEGGCPAHALIARWERQEGGDPAGMIEYLSRNTLNEIG
jgi:glutamate--cysteine ligase